MDELDPQMVAPDGSPVGLYGVLPPGPEVELVAGATPAGGAVLDLGSGAGRLADPLSARGFDVVAVDESEAMLANVTLARTVKSRIETLQLPQRFDTVVLGSHLVHGSTRAELLSTVRRHLKHDGKGLVERYDPQWVRAAGPGAIQWGGVQFVLRDVRRSSEDRLAAVIEYRWRDHVWSQPFVADAVPDDEVARWFQAAGLDLAGWLSPSWAEARVADGSAV